MSSQTENDREASGRPGRVWILVGVLAAAAGFVVMLVAGSGDGVSEEAAAREDSIPYVETATIEPAGNRYQVTAPGRLQARETLSLVGEVSGKVTGINPNLELGGRIGKGEIILKIDDGDFRADLARADAQVSTAKARVEQA
ncbi:MAG: hypothetical protein WA989_13240, partial [Henriciella sp.]